MRELRFRAWDNVKFKMYYVGESEDVVFSFDGNGITATDITEHDWGFKKLEHLQYMQFTGLHDKNGKPIYEGDLLKERHRSNDKSFYEVVWQNNGFQLKYTFTRKYQGEEYTDTNYLPIYPDSYAVVGNIYEGVSE